MPSHIKNLFENEEKRSHYKPIIIGNFLSSNYIE